MRKEKAPWPDFAGNDIFEGDLIKHPDGSKGVVMKLFDSGSPSDDWRIDYDGGFVLRLCLQIGDKGRAVKIEASDG